MSKPGQRGNSEAYPRGRPRIVQALIVLTALLLVWLLAASPLGHIADNNANDAYFRWFPATQADPTTTSTLLAIDEETLSQHGGIRNLRALVTKVAEALAAAPPSVLAIDLTLADPGDPTEDVALATALSKLPHVVLGAEIRPDGTQWEVPSPSITASNTSIAHVHAAPDPMDAVCREIPLEKALNTKRYWALSLEAYRLWRSEPYILETNSSLMIGAVEIPARRDTGRLLRIRFLPPGEQDVSSVKRISVADLLAAGHPRAELKDSVVFLGVTAPSAARDRLMTPFSYGRSMQGVEIHANAFETLASGRFLRDVRPGMLFLGSLLLAGLIWWAFATFRDNRSYVVAAVVLLVSLILPPAAFVQANVASTTTLVGSAWLPFLGLAAQRYWFVNRRLKHATRETENYRNAIHYVTHEMRTPLTAIQGSSELISRYRLGEDKQREIATLIHSESKRLGRLIQVFLDVERLSAGEMQLRADHFPASELIQTCLHRAAPLAEAKEIVLHTHSSEDLFIVGDRELLEHALYNLVTNAIKYSPNGTEVHVSSRTNGNRIFLDVKDQGAGLTDAEQKAVFRKFYRTASAEASGVRGSGIGLSIVEQILIAHHGRVLVTSVPGVGSTFTLELPLQPPATNGRSD
jgi:signal transduction histidine kinase